MKLKKLTTLTRTIPVYVPQDGEDYSKEKQTVKYRVISQEQLDDLLKANDADRAVFDAVVAGLPGLKGADGDTLEDNESTWAMAREVDYFRTAVVQEYFIVMRGGQRGKN